MIPVSVPTVSRRLPSSNSLTKAPIVYPNSVEGPHLRGTAGSDVPDSDLPKVLNSASAVLRTMWRLLFDLRKLPSASNTLQNRNKAAAHDFRNLPHITSGTIPTPCSTLPCIHRCMHARMHAYIHTYIHTYPYTYTYMNEYIYIYIHELLGSSLKAGGALWKRRR